MPAPRSFWVILIGKTPTSFRAKAREDLLPTLRQLQRTQTDVTLRWFERGKVWESPEAAIGAAKLAATEAREKRTREWRPGGEHRDPKARFEMTRDQKRAKFKRERSGGHERPESPFGPRRPKPPKADGKPARSPFDRTRSDRPPSGRPFSDRGPRPPRGDSRDRLEVPGRPAAGDRPSGDRPQRRDRPVHPPMENPFKDRPRTDRRPDRRSDRGPDSKRPGRPPASRGGDKPPRRRS